MSVKRKRLFMKIEDFSSKSPDSKKTLVDPDSQISVFLITMQNPSSQVGSATPNIVTEELKGVPSPSDADGQHHQSNDANSSADGKSKSTTTLPGGVPSPSDADGQHQRSNDANSSADGKSKSTTTLPGGVPSPSDTDGQHQRSNDANSSADGKSKSTTTLPGANNIKKFISQRRMDRRKMMVNEFFIKDDYEIAISAHKMVKSNTAVLYDHKMGDHLCLWDKDYPESPDRYFAIINRCNALELFERCVKLEIKPATREQIWTLHTMDLYNKLAQISYTATESEMETEASQYDSVYFNKETFDTALISAGAAIELVENVCNGTVQNGFAIVRPPGHHAMNDEFCGYCFFNNVALAAQHALDNKLAERILIVDYDVHHGQATQRMFYNDKRVLYFSIHRYEYGEFWPNLRESNYDFIGEDAGKGYNVNVPLNTTGLGDSEYLTIVTQLLLPLGYEFEPDLVIISAGYDACIGCPEGKMEVTPGFYGHLIRLLSGLANGKIAVCLEGGYFLPSLAEGAAMTLKSLLGDPLPMLEPMKEPHPLVVEVIDALKVRLEKYWNCFKFLPVEAPTHDVVKYVGVPLTPPYPTRNWYFTNTPEYIEKYNKIVNLHRNATEELGTNLIVACCYDPDMLKHDTSRSVVEKPERLLSAYNLYKEWGLHDRCLNLQPKAIDASIIKLIHSQDYVDDLLDNQLEKLTEKDGDMYYNDETLNAVLKSAGSVLSILESVMNNEANCGAAFVRPPGHHAEAEKSMGFCFINNVALAAQYAIDNYNLSKILILDFDIHHGNGIQKIFYETDKVLYLSIHRFDKGRFFPRSLDADFYNCGTGSGIGYNINIPLSQHKHYNEDYMNIFYQIVLPVAYSYAPQLILISAGFDAGINDLLGNYQLTPECFGHFVQLVKPLASGKVIVVMEGGYNPITVKYSMNICVKTLLGDPLPVLDFRKRRYRSTYRKVLKNVLNVHKKTWPALLAPQSVESSESTTTSESEVIVEALKTQNLQS